MKELLRPRMLLIYDACIAAGYLLWVVINR